MTLTTTHLKFKIIVVDNEETVADTLKLVLDEFGCDTRVAYTSETGVELLRDFQPDMLITEVIMPGITGIEAALQVLARLPSCKVLLMSADEATGALLDAARAQDHHFEVLVKPFHPEDLLAKIRRVTATA